jgi:predicted glycosyltransferase
VLKTLGVDENDSYVVIRFVSRKSSHDVGSRGISLALKRHMVRSLSEHARVFISAEETLPDDLEPFRLRIAPWQMHDVLNYAQLYVGDSATMASEAAVLGVPAVFLDQRGRFYTDEEEKKYGLVFNFTLSEADIYKAIEKSVQLLSNPRLKADLAENRNRLLADHIDVTAFLVRFTLEFPQSR